MKIDFIKIFFRPKTKIGRNVLLPHTTGSKALPPSGVDFRWGGSRVLWP